MISGTFVPVLFIGCCHFYMLSGSPPPSNDTSSTGIINVHTPNLYNYVNLGKYGLHINHSVLVFEVQACNDAHIGLFSHEPSLDKGYLYEIVIGGWANGQSVIRNAKQGDNKITYKGKVLDCNTYKAFWISWISGHVKVGRGNIVGNDEFMQWEDPTPHTVNYTGVSTGWGSQGNWIFNIPYSFAISDRLSNGTTVSPNKGTGIINVQTPNLYNYVNLEKYGLHINNSVLAFEVQACNDAHIGLFSQEPSLDKGYLYEIVIGGWANGQSVIRNTKQGDNKITYKGKLLDCNAYKAFWISWTSGHVKVGRGNIVGNDEFMQWIDTAPHTVNYVGVSTGWGSKGKWMFNISYLLTTLAKNASKSTANIKASSWCLPISPCHNRAKCVSSEATYDCYCNSELWYGAHCERQFVICSRNPCQHGGSCSLDTNGLGVCNCRIGFIGDFCDIEKQAVPHWKETFSDLDSWNGLYYFANKKVSFSLSISKVVFGSDSMVLATVKDKDTVAQMRGFSRDNVYITFELISVSTPSSRIKTDFELSGILTRHKIDDRWEYTGKITKPKNDTFGAFRLYSKDAEDPAKTVALTVGLGIFFSILFVAIVIITVVILIRKGYIKRPNISSNQMDYYIMDKNKY